MKVMDSFKNNTDTKIATGNSIALNIEANPPPTFGTAIERSKMGNIIPNKPSINPYFQRPFVNCPFQIISGVSTRLIIIRATMEMINVRVIVVIPSTERELI